MAIQARGEHAIDKPASVWHEIRTLQGETYDFVGAIANSGAAVMARAAEGILGHQVFEPGQGDAHYAPGAYTGYSVGDVHHKIKRQIDSETRLTLTLTDVQAVQYRRFYTATGEFDSEPSRGTVGLRFSARRSDMQPSDARMRVHYGLPADRRIYAAELSAGNTRLGRLGAQPVSSRDLALLERPAEVTVADYIDGPSIRGAYASRFVGQIAAAVSFAEVIDDFARAHSDTQGVSVPEHGAKLVTAWRGIAPLSVDHTLDIYGFRSGLLTPVAAEQLGVQSIV